MRALLLLALCSCSASNGLADGAADNGLPEMSLDMTDGADLVMTRDPDLSTASDLATSSDLAPSSDLAQPNDLRTAADMSTPPDLTPAADMACGAVGASCNGPSDPPCCPYYASPQGNLQVICGPQLKCCFHGVLGC